MDQSIERLIPDELESTTTGDGTLQLHLERYRLAKQYAIRGDVLDIACGVGYGTYLLSDNEVECTGVDVDSEAIQYATRRYDRPNVRFFHGDAMTFDNGRKFGTIVSLETIEHVPDPQGLVDHLVGLLAPGGYFIGSVPTTPSVDFNPFHLTDFTRKSFLRMFAKHPLEKVEEFEQVQWFNPITILMGAEKRTTDLRSGVLRYYLRQPRSLMRRLWSTATLGFSNRYLTVVYRREPA